MTTKFRVVWMIVEATPSSETDFDVNTTQLEESEETRRLKHKTIPRHVSKDKNDARQIAHLQSRSRSGVTVDQAHGPQAGTHEGEDRREKDHIFLSNTTDPQHVKVVSNRLESEAAFSAMSVNRVEARLVCACEAFRPTDRTRLNEMRAVKNTVCNTPKASSVNAGRIEQASQKFEKRSRTLRFFFLVRRNIGRTCMQSDARHGAELCEADFTPPCEARQSEADRGVASNHGHVSTFTKMNHFTDGEWNLRLWRDAVMVSSGHWRSTLARVRRCRLLWRRPVRDFRARTQDIVVNEVVQTENQRKFECLTRKLTEQFEQRLWTGTRSAVKPRVNILDICLNHRR